MQTIDPQTTRVQEVFDEWALGGRAAGMERRHGPYARRAFDWLELKVGERYLDIGCGNGYSVRWAAAQNGSVDALGLDVAPEMIELARRMSAEQHNAAFICDSFPSASLQPASFATIFSMEALYYLPDLDGALAEIRRLLTPEGRFACVVDFFEENEESRTWPSDLGVAMTRLSIPGWHDAFVRAGLKVCLQERVENSLITCGRPQL